MKIVSSEYIVRENVEQRERETERDRQKERKVRTGTDLFGKEEKLVIDYVGGAATSTAKEDRLNDKV